jgi:hypothetical protein
VLSVSSAAIAAASQSWTPHVLIARSKVAAALGACMGFISVGDERTASEGQAGGGNRRWLARDMGDPGWGEGEMR